MHHTRQLPPHRMPILIPSLWQHAPPCGPRRRTERAATAASLPPARPFRPPSSIRASVRDRRGLADPPMSPELFSTADEVMDPRPAALVSYACPSYHHLTQCLMPVLARASPATRLLSGQYHCTRPHGTHPRTTAVTRCPATDPALQTVLKYSWDVHPPLPHPRTTSWLSSIFSACSIRSSPKLACRRRPLPLCPCQEMCSSSVKRLYDEVFSSTYAPAGCHPSAASNSGRR